MSLPQLGRIERAVKAIVLPNSPGLLRLRKSSWWVANSSVFDSSSPRLL